MPQAVGHPRLLTLIRHGESAGNVANAAALAGGLHQLDIADRDVDVALSERGHDQSTALAQWFRGQERPDVVFSSPYRRAIETACIGLRAAGIDAPVVQDERLREREFGARPPHEVRHPGPPS